VLSFFPIIVTGHFCLWLDRTVLSGSDCCKKNNLSLWSTWGRWPMLKSVLHTWSPL